MTCNNCEKELQSTQPVIVSVKKSGTHALVSVQNKGKHVVMIRRIVLCYTTSGGMGYLFLRAPPDQISWLYPSAFFEPGISVSVYDFNASDAKIVQAQAEYIEINNRSLSCAQEF